MVLQNLNETEVACSLDRLVHELFEEQAIQTPDAIAVTYANQSLTYADLNIRANKLARYLKGCGVAADQPVGICVERGPEAVVCVLAILKAGGAYLPLDPKYPADRLQYMLEDAAPSVLLTQQMLKVVLPDSKPKIVEVDAHWPDIAERAGENLATEQRMRSLNLVYVIYTSGSTGRPKGTAMSHRSMVNLIEWHRRTFGAEQGRRVLQFAPLSFDVAFQETFSTLCTGGNLVLVDEWVRRDPQALIEFLIDHSIETLFLPPVILQRLVESRKPGVERLTALKDVVVAGEQLRITPTISEFFHLLRGCRLHNHYGPTESHVVTAFTLPTATDEWPLLPPIGRPVSNTQIYVLDEQRRPVPPGATGEIYIGGAGVARGYLKRPELTAQRFVSNPFGTLGHDRLYKTGDLGRWRSDGVLEYLGRNDFQLKIRGFRVEPGEVENVLEGYPSVRQAVVVAREDEPGEKRLVGYVVLDQSTRQSPQSVNADLADVKPTPSLIPQMRAFLEEKLPQFMIPTSIVVLEELPLLPNGKVDRSMLPAPEPERQVEQPYAPPSTPMETALSGVWAEALSLEQVGIDDNFFELGGDSVMGLELINRVAEVLEIKELSIVALFEAPTIREMAQFIQPMSPIAQSRPILD